MLEIKQIKNEKGVASIVFVMIIGLAITASSISVMSSIRGSQEINTASNAVTHSQNGMWIGAEAFRQYLNTLSTNANVSGLNNATGLVIDLNNPNFGALTANDISVRNTPDLTDAPNVLEVTATIENQHAASKTSSAIRVVYNFTPASIPPTPSGDGLFEMNFDGNLTLNGGLELYNGGAPIDLTVNGDVDINNVGVNTIGEIATTGSVSIGSSVAAESVYANGDVVLEGGANIETIQSLGMIEVKGGAQVNQAFSNGDLIIGNTNTEILRSRKSVTVAGSGHHKYIDAGETIGFTNGGSSADTLRAVGDIDYPHWGSLGEVVSMGDVNCVSVWWKKFDSLSANGSLNNCTDSPEPGSTVESGASNVVVPLAEIPPYEHESLSIDVWLLRTTAHYFFEYDDEMDKIKVTVNNINDVPTGVYHIGNYNGDNSNRMNYLCTDFDGSGSCTLPSEPLSTVCVGPSLFDECIKYDKDTETFTFLAANTAPGIMLFDGNLHLQNGHSMSTFLAAGSISTSGGFRAWTPNFGGYEKICAGDGDHIGGSRARYEAEFSKHYPRNLCDIDTTTYRSLSTANIAMAAGGFHPTNPGLYSGGNISLGSSTEIVGSVFAGNFLSTGGNTVIHGLIAAAVDGEPIGSNLFNGRTFIDVATIHEHFDPTAVPIVDGQFQLPDPVLATTVLQFSRNL